MFNPQAKQFQGTSPSLHIQIKQANKLLRLHFLSVFFVVILLVFNIQNLD